MCLVIFPICILILLIIGFILSLLFSSNKQSEELTLPYPTTIPKMAPKCDDCRMAGCECGEGGTCDSKTGLCKCKPEWYGGKKGKNNCKTRRVCTGNFATGKYGCAGSDCIGEADPKSVKNQTCSCYNNYLDPNVGCQQTMCDKYGKANGGESCSGKGIPSLSNKGYGECEKCTCSYPNADPTKACAVCKSGWKGPTCSDKLKAGEKNYPYAEYGSEDENGNKLYHCNGPVDNNSAKLCCNQCRGYTCKKQGSQWSSDDYSIGNDPYFSCNCNC